MRCVSEETRIADECCKSGGPRATARTMNFDIRETGDEGSTRERATAALFFFFFLVRSRLANLRRDYITPGTLGRNDISIGRVKAARDIINDER